MNYLLLLLYYVIVIVIVIANSNSNSNSVIVIVIVMVWYGISLRILARDLLTSLFTPLTHYMWYVVSVLSHSNSSR